MQKWIAGLFCWVWMLGAGPAAAQLVSRDDPVFGPGSITFDPLTSLEWLDVTESANRSYNDLIGLDGSDEFAPGGDFEGFQHATAAEVALLAQHAGIANPFGQFMVPGLFVPVQDLQSLIGVTTTLSNPDVESVFAISEDSTVATGSRDFSVFTANFTEMTGNADVVNGGFSDATASPVFGHMLIRVPEPGAGALTLTALASLAALRKRAR